MDVLEENLWSVPEPTEYGPVPAFDDVVGTKVRALADRGAVRDLIDVHAASLHRSLPDLERLGARHGRDQFRLDDGLDDEVIARLRAWARRWSDDIDGRLAGESAH